jgi:hypothetical protein
MHCPGTSKQLKVRNMKRDKQWNLRIAGGLFLFLALVAGVEAQQPTEAATTAFNSYIGAAEARLERMHASAQLRAGQLVIERITQPGSEKLPGALLHDWRGTAFVPGGKAADFERLMKDYDAYPRIYSPEMLFAHVISHDGNHYVVTMRVRQKHIVTAVLDITYDITFGSAGGNSGATEAQSRYSISRSTHITEIDNAGTSQEHALDPGEEHGYMWRQNTYWSCQERDGGLYIQIESITLTRSFPKGLGWAIGSFVESIPRETLEFTLRSTGNALKK